MGPVPGGSRPHRRKRAGWIPPPRAGDFRRSVQRALSDRDVLPLTGTRGKRRRVYPFEVILDRGMAGNPEESIAMPQQIRTVSKSRLRGRMGRLSDRAVQRTIERRLLEHLAIEYEIAGPGSGA